MSSPIELRKVSVESEALGDNFKPSGVILSAQVGALPQARIRVHTGAEGQSVGSHAMPDFSQMIDVNTKWQKDTFSDDKSTASITINDNVLGGGNEITMKGIIAAPEFAIVPGNVNIGMTLMHEDVLLQNFNTSIYYGISPAGYGSHQGLANAPLANNLCDPAYIEDVGVNEHIEYVLKETHENKDFQATIKASSLDETEKVKQATFEQNKASLGRVKEFLKNSPNTRMQVDPSPGNPLKDMPMFDPYRAVADIGAYYTWLGRRFTSSGNFMTFVTNAIAQEFLFDFICNMDGRAKLQHGKWEHTEEATKTLKIQEIHYSLAPRYQRALGQVISQAQSRPEGGAGPANDEIIGAHPNPATPRNGKIQWTSAPDWFKPTGWHHEQYYIYSPKGNRDIDKNGDGIVDKAEIAAVVLDGEDLKPSFLTVFANKAYNWTALQGATCQLVTPLDVSWGSENGSPLGERYQIKSAENGALLFRGFLSNVTHNLRLEGASAGEATTRLSFSHVKMPGFELPAGSI